MMTCQLDSKTKQLAALPRCFCMLPIPFLALGLSPPEFRPFAYVVYGAQSLLHIAVNGSVTRLEQGLVSQCRPRHFCHVEQVPAPSSPSSVAANTAFTIQITPLFSLACDFMTAIRPCWSDKCFVGADRVVTCQVGEGGRV